MLALEAVKDAVKPRQAYNDVEVMFVSGYVVKNYGTPAQWARDEMMREMNLREDLQREDLQRLVRILEVYGC